MRALPLSDSVPDGVQAWLLPLDLRAPIKQSDWHLLSEDEKTRVERFHQPADRVRMAATRAALRRQLAQRLGCAPAALCFELGPNDKPRLGSQGGHKPAVTFNVSHSGEYALIAVSTAPGVACLGVDIEQRRADLDLEDLAEYAFTPSERAFLRRCKPCAGESGEAPGLDYASAFFLTWVTKEAALKALGVGISEHLQTLSVRIVNERHKTSSTALNLALEHQRVEWRPLQVSPLQAPGGYCAAIAWQVWPGRYRLAGMARQIWPGQCSKANPAPVR